jgi:hypothetical protein
MDKPNLFDNLKEISHRISLCGNLPDIRQIEISDAVAYSKDYRLKCCRGLNGAITENSFDLVFNFADYKDDGKIRFIEIKALRRKIFPVLPVP